MFFTLSKTLGLLIKPHILALLLLGVALVLRLLKLSPRWRPRLVIGAVAWLWLMSTGVVANLLLYPLETRYRRPAELAEEPAAIVMLGGTIDPDILGSYFEFTMAADRFVEVLRLAHLHPRAKVLLSGGSGDLLEQGFREASVLRRLMRELEIPAERILVDINSRNTRENALRSSELLAQIQGPVLLVTSAYHMPRSMACFTKAGLRAIPWPTDYQRTSSASLSAFIPSPSALQLSEAALHEYLGWLTYMVAGYI